MKDLVRIKVRKCPDCFGPARFPTIKPIELLPKDIQRKELLCDKCYEIDQGLAK